MFVLSHYSHLSFNFISNAQAADQADYLNCESMFTDASSVSLDTSCLAEVPAFATEVLCAPMLDRSTVADSSKHDSAELVDSLYFTIAAVGIAGTGVPDGATDAQVPKRDDPLSAAQPEPAEVSYPLDSCNPAPCIAQSGEDQRTAAGHLDGAGDSKLSNEVVDGREGDHAADESTDAVPQDARVIAFDEQRVADGSEASFSVCSFGMPHGAVRIHLHSMKINFQMYVTVIFLFCFFRRLTRPTTSTATACSLMRLASVWILLVWP